MNVLLVPSNEGASLRLEDDVPIGFKFIDWLREKHPDLDQVSADMFPKTLKSLRGTEILVPEVLARESEVFEKASVYCVSIDEEVLDSLLSLVLDIRKDAAKKIVGIDIRQKINEDEFLTLWEDRGFPEELTISSKESEVDEDNFCTVVAEKA